MNQKEMEQYHQRSDILATAAKDMEKLCEELNMKEQSGKMNEIVQQVETHRFSVGIMGEFRRGKSTVINSLLGEKVMPSSVNPCSATMNRVTFGEEKQAMILMKDGNLKKVPIDELPRYVTKLKKYDDAYNDVEEAVVYYPTGFCKDGVDIIDTPGMNDDERMDKVSENIVPKLDVMIMTMIPDSPLSRSEARFVRDTLLTHDLSRMIFLVNKIDNIDEEDRPELLENIRDRIRENVLFEMENLMGRDSDMYRKAEKVLDDIHLYPISARDSLRGKLEGNPILVEESGAVAFENALTSLLTNERAALTLGHAISILFSTGLDVEQELNSRREAFDMTAQEFEQKQDELEAAKKQITADQEKELAQLEANENKLKQELLAKANAYYGNMEAELHSIVDDEAAKWDMTRFDKPEEQASVSGKLQAKVEDSLNEKTKAFSVQIIKEMEQVLGEEAKSISAFTSGAEQKMKRIVHGSSNDKFMDGGDIAATVIDVITDYSGIFGIGGLIAGARAAGVKGALVGGGIGLATSIALIYALPIVGIPLAIASCAGGTLASKWATKLIFKKDIAEKKRKEIVSSIKNSITTTIQTLRDNKQLEVWVETQVMDAYGNLRNTMAQECERIINETATSLKEIDKARKTAAQEHEDKKKEFDILNDRCSEILTRVKPVAEWLNEANKRS